jgi:hypothetical protein
MSVCCATKSKLREWDVIPKRYADLLFSTIQAGVTTGVTAAIATAELWHREGAFYFWLRAWLGAWIAMIPLVALLAPQNRRLVNFLIRDRTGSR